MATQQKQKLISAIFVALFSTALTAALVFMGLFYSWHLKIADSLYTKQNPSDQIVIIAIDDKSTSHDTLGRFGQWTRENYTKLLEKLQQNPPKVIAFDLFFHDFSRGASENALLQLTGEIDSASNNKQKLEIFEQFVDNYSSVVAHPIDKQFGLILQEFKNIVLATNISEEADARTAIIPRLLQGNPAIAGATITLDPDGIARRVKPQYFLPSENKTYDDLALASVKQYLDLGDDEAENLQIPLEDGKMNVNFFGDPGSYKTVSFVDILNGDINPQTLEGKIALIGVTSFKEINDTVLTPRSNTIPMSGIEFRANEIQTILDQEFLSNQTPLAVLVFSTILALLMSLLVANFGVIISGAGLVLLIAAYYFGAHLAYGYGYIFNMIYPFIAIILAFISGWLYKYLVLDKDKRKLKDAFSHYVSDKLVKKIIQNPDSVKLGGQSKVVTVFFTDIQDSTKLSEQVNIESWVAQINEYFTVMEAVIKKFDGTIDKYEGDAIMGFFNAPIDQQDHVLRAYLTALEMKKALEELNKNWQLQGKTPLNFRVGINTGEAIVGNFGSQNRFDYTVMGDTINTASRLESSANKAYSTQIIVAGFENHISLENLAEKVVLKELDEVILPGKSQSSKVYELVCTPDQLDEKKRLNLDNFKLGLEAYRRKDFMRALEHFKDCIDDKSAEVFKARCEILNSGQGIEQLDESMIFRILNK